MKKKLLVVVLGLTMVFASCAVAFGSLTDVQSAIDGAGIRTVLKFNDEVGAEAYATTFYKDVKDGKYGLKDTAAVKKIVDSKADYLIIDTMPAGWYGSQHIPGAKNVYASLKKDAKAENWASYKKGNGKKAVDAVKKLCKKGKKVNYKQKIVVYCGFVGCDRSHMLAKYLKQAGFKNVYRYAGGITAWADAGYEVEGTNK